MNLGKYCFQCVSFNLTDSFSGYGVCLNLGNANIYVNKLDVCLFHRSLSYDISSLGACPVCGVGGDNVCGM